MISLVEDYVGHEANDLVIHGLKVCGGLVLHLRGAAPALTPYLAGAHFTPATTSDEILTACTWLREHAVGARTVQKMWFVFKLSEWQKRADKYSNAHTLLTELKAMFNYNGQIWTYDQSMIGNSVDLKVDAAGTLYRRATPNPDPTTIVPTNDVKHIKTANGSKTPTANTLAGFRLHANQNDQNNWAAFAQGAMVPV